METAGKWWSRSVSGITTRVRSGRARSGHIKSGHIKSGHIKSGRFKSCLFALFVLTGLGPAGVWADCAPDIAELQWQGGSARFSVELADTAETRARGLMFVESMPQFSGMLFIYPKEQPASFWMRNTLIPLDMLFFDGTGRLLSLHENTIPLDETPLAGGANVQFVLEVNGGTRALLRMSEPIILRHPAISPSKALWPCP